MEEIKLITVVRAVFKFKDKYLVIEQQNASGNTYLLFPGGHTKMGESLQGAIVREVDEELNIHDIDIKKIVYIKETLSPFDRDYEIFFECITSVNFSDIKVKQEKYTGNEKINKCIFLTKEELILRPNFYPKNFFSDKNYQYLEMDINEHIRLFGDVIHIND